MKQPGAFLTQPMLIVTVALVGLNLRPFITSIGPLIANIRTATGLSLQGIALLTLLPMMLMGPHCICWPNIAELCRRTKSYSWCIAGHLWRMCCPFFIAYIRRINY